MMQVLATRTNRLTRGKVSLCKEGDVYVAICEHGIRFFEHRHKSYVVDWMSKPWLQCHRCQQLKMVALGY
jgi:hypothetical protein